MMHIRSFEPMPTRPCKFCLALQDDSVFADFDINQNDCLYLIRISFDGYGCCHLDLKIGIGEIDKETTKLLIKNIKKNNFKTPESSEILSSYFRANKDMIWENALLDHELI